MILSVEISKNSCKDFIDYWKEKYRYGNETVYECHINKDLTKEKASLQRLFVWKNGHRQPSQVKQANINEKINWLNSQSVKSCEKNQVIEKAKMKYLNCKRSGAVWNIFFLHCLDQEEWPIYDQHTYRAMMYIKTGEIPEDEKNDCEKYENYRKKYRCFIKTKFKGCDRRDVDKALFAFGKFLKTYKT